MQRKISQPNRIRIELKLCSFTQKLISDPNVSLEPAPWKLQQAPLSSAPIVEIFTIYLSCLLSFRNLEGRLIEESTPPTHLLQVGEKKVRTWPCKKWKEWQFRALYSDLPFSFFTCGSQHWVRDYWRTQLRKISWTKWTSKKEGWQIKRKVKKNRGGGIQW